MVYFAGFLLLIVLLEVCIGRAVFWRRSSVTTYLRNEEPAAFWFTVALHAFFGLMLPLATYWSTK